MTKSDSLSLGVEENSADEGEEWAGTDAPAEAERGQPPKSQSGCIN